MDGIDDLVPTTAPPPTDPPPVTPTPTDPDEALAAQRAAIRARSPAPVATPAQTDPDEDLAEQRAFGRRAVLTSAMVDAIQKDPEKQAKIQSLADAMGAQGAVDGENYDALKQKVDLQRIDYAKLLRVHPELSKWLTDNASTSHDEIPQLQHLDNAAKALDGRQRDPNGILPDGYAFMSDGRIRGKVNLDGQSIIYTNLADLEQKTEWGRVQAALRADENDRAAADSVFPNVGAGVRQSLASTLAALGSVGGSDTENRQEVRRSADEQLAEAAARDPSMSGGLARIVGSLIGDAPLYALGGEAVGVADAVAGATEGASAVLAANKGLAAERTIASSIRGSRDALYTRAVSQLAESLAPIKAANILSELPQSEYLKDVWKTALAYSPIAARSGVNTGSDNGAVYGSVDFLINALGPAAFGSKTGLAAAIVPGEETAAAAEGWGGVAGRLMKHVGAQAGVMAATEMANALHEFATGVNPDALKNENLLPRLAQAGAMGAVLSGAFHLPMAIRDHVYRGQIAANAALMHADGLGALMESVEALKSPERTPQRFNELLQDLVPATQRNKFLQGEDFEGIAKTAGVKPEDLAQQMGIGDEYRKAVATGQAMTVPTHVLLKYGAEHEDPIVKKALVTAARDNPNGINANEAVKFYKDTPDELAKQKLELESDVTKAASEMRESDPIYQDMMQQVENAGRPADEAKANAKLMAAAFNTLAHRHNAGAKERGAKLVDPFEEYQKYRLRVEAEATGTGIEPLDAMLDRARSGKFPTERQASGKSLMEFLAARGVKDPTGVIAKAGAKKLVDEGGHNLELAAERAHDEGYIEDAKPETLIDAIKKEAAGEKVLSEANRNPELHDIRYAVLGLHEHLKSKGIDISRPNAEIKAALAGDPMAARFEQRIEPATSFLTFDRLLKQWKKANGDRSPTPGDKDWSRLEEQARRVDEAQGRKFFQGDDRSLSEITEAWESKGVKIDAHESASDINISRLVVPATERGKGLGSLVMREIAAYADRSGRRITLSPSVDFGGSSVDRLKRFYKQFGFVENKGKNKDFTIRDTMYREPRQHFEQPGEGGHRGSLEFSDQRHFLMTLTGRANLSTVLHESGHFYLEVLGDFASRDDAAPQIKSDYAKILDYLGAKDRASITTEHHEKFARAIETYLMEGHAPSPELRGTFQRFAIWLGAIYSKFKALVHLTPEVKGVFDRLLATDEAITQVQNELGTSTIFKDQASSGMNDAAWGKYLRSVQTERQRSQSNVFAKAMKVLRQENTRAFTREMDRAKSGAESIVRNRPINILVGEMVHRIDVNGNEIAEKPRLNREQIVREYGSTKGLPRGITAEEGGLSLEEAAEAYHVGSAEDLWTGLQNYKKPHEQVRELSEQIVKAQHPELSPEAMHEAAMEAVHANSSHADILSQESAALAIHALRKPIPQEQMKAIAERMVDETNYLDVNPDAHLRAEMRASDASTKAFLQVPPDYTAAFLHKQREELSHALYRASMEAKDTIEAANTLMRKLQKTSTLQEIGKAGGYVVTGKNGERLITVDPTEAQQLAQQYEGTTESYLQAVMRMLEFWGKGEGNRAQRFNMDFGELNDFYREADAIHYQAKQAFNLIQGEKTAKLAEVVGDLNARQTEAVKDGHVIVPRDKKGLTYQAKTWFRQFDAGNRTLAAICRTMDGERAAGPHWENIVRPLNDAANDEQVRRIANSQAMTDLIKAWGKRGKKESVYVPSVGDHLSLETRIGVLLNAGTKPNLERMMTGDKWTRQQISDIIKTLDEKDIALAKGIWAHLESKWGEISALHQRLTGIPPVKKETLPVETRFGTIDGGYYPILYDKEVSARAFELTLDKPTNPSMGSPRSGFTEQTVETTGLRLQYGFSALFRHDSDTAHYLSHAEVASNLNKLLNNPSFKASVVDRFGMTTHEAMTERVRNVLQGPRGPQNAFERAVRFIRQRSGLATIGYSAMTVAVHGFGVPQSMHRVGAVEWMAAQGQLIASATSMESGYRFIDGKSSFMRDGRHNFTPEMDEAISRGLPGGVLQKVQDHALDGLHMALRLINSATWMAEYKTRLAEKRGEGASEADHDDRAVALADQAVRDTQGGGQTVDKTRYQDANEFSRMFMQYTIFFTRTYQLLRPSIAGVGADPKNPATYWAAAKALAVLVVLPAVTESLFKQVVKPSPGDDTSAKFWAERLAKANMEYLLSTVIGGREVASVLDGNLFGGPASSRSVSSMATAVGALKHLVEDPNASTAGKAGRSGLAMAGLLFGIPSNQIDHIIQGVLHNVDQHSLNPAPILFGPPAGH